MFSLDQNNQFYWLCDIEIWWITVKNNRAPLLSPLQLCALFPSHLWIQTEVTVQKCSVWVKIVNFSAYVTLEFEGWPWKTIGHLFYTSSSLVHVFVAICEFKLQIRAKLVLTSVTFTFNLWPWLFTRTSFLWVVLTPQNFMMIQCKHSKEGMTDWRMDGLNHS